MHLQNAAQILQQAPGDQLIRAMDHSFRHEGFSVLKSSQAFPLGVPLVRNEVGCSSHKVKSKCDI